MTTVLYVDESGAFGGAITCMAHLIQHLDQQRFRPVVCAHHEDPILRERLPGVPISILRRRKIGSGKTGKRLQEFLTSRFGRRGARIFALGQTFVGLGFDILPRVLAIWNIGRRHSVDLVHANNSLEINLAGILAARALRVPCVAYIRNFEAVGRFQKWILRRVDRVVIQSHAQKEHLTRGGLDADKITIIPETISLEEIAAFEEPTPTRERRPTYGITGMLVPWKGHRTFLRAAVIIQRRLPRAAGLIFGDETPMNPGYAKELRTYATSLGLENTVEFRGLVPDMADAFREIDVFVHASDSPEPFGRVIIEAMAAGKPVVAADAGGPREIVVPGETGLLFKPKNPQALADAIQRLLENDNLRARMGQAGRERVLRQFRAAEQARNVAALFDAVLSLHGAQTSTLS